MKYFYILIISIIMITACGEEEKKEMPQDPHAGMNMQGMGSTEMFESSESNMKMDGQTLTFENVTMTVPADWIMEKPASSMRVIQFFSKQDEEFVIAGFYFGNRDEMINQNIQRWESQFAKLDKSETTEFASGNAVFVELEGTYNKKPFPMAQEFEETPGYKTLAAIVKTDKGPYFFKAVSLKKSADNEIENFKSFLDSYKVK